MSDDERARIRALHPNIEPQWLPHPSRYAQFTALVLWEDGCDEAGNFLGFCPLHDKERDVEAPSAEYNFHKGVMRCQGDPSCHDGKRAMSLNNVVARMSDGGN